MSDFSFLKERKYIFVYLALQFNKQNKYLDKLLKTYEEQKEAIKDYFPKYTHSCMKLELLLNEIKYFQCSLITYFILLNFVCLFGNLTHICVSKSSLGLF